ncbi:MAG: nitronate monooxygenase [Christensenellales bacterium]|jgi:enoyl-[acyl-carrier protein] reductase II
MDLRNLLGIEYPIIQGGMANIATGAFAALISEIGGLGLIASGGYSADQLREQIRIARSKTKKPIGVNLMMMHPQVEEIAALLIEERVSVVTTGAGMPGKYIPGWKEAGIKVFPVIPSVALARRVAAQGADGVIAEGCESGGHVGELTTMALVPQVVDALDIPVVAAGGIASGRQMLAALALGACGVQIGTTLLRAQECPIHDNYKQAILKAKDTDTTVTGRIAGVPVRILKNKMAQEYLKLEKSGASRDELEHFTLGSLRRAVFDGDTSNGSLMAGQVAGQLKEIQPAEAIIKGLFEDCKKAFAALGAHPLLKSKGNAE